MTKTELTFRLGELQNKKHNAETLLTEYNKEMEFLYTLITNWPQNDLDAGAEAIKTAEEAKAATEEAEKNGTVPQKESEKMSDEVSKKRMAKKEV